MNSTARARLESKIDKTSEPEHHLWRGQLDRDGYPKFSWREGGKRYYQRVTRIVLEEKIGRPLGPQMMACHVRECLHKHCCRPEHLYEGTAQQNAADMVACGRSLRGDLNPARAHPEHLKRGDDNPSKRCGDRISAGLRRWHREHPELTVRGDRSGARLHPETRPRGESHHKALVSDADMERAIDRVRAGETRTAVARDLGVTKSTVSRWVLGKFRAGFSPTQNHGIA